jgi:glycosyltransferase involved in cell wall biosynthesis
MKVSIVTPSFNQGDFLGQAIRSVVEQKSSNFILDYTVKDNCSTDSSAEQMAAFSDSDGLSIVVSKDGGQAEALHSIFSQSDGDILGWLNSDDLYLPGALEYVADAFKRHPEIDVVYGEAYFIDSAGNIIGRYPTTEFDIELMLNACFLSQPSVFFRRSLYEKVGGLDTALNYCLDYNLWIRFAMSDAHFMRSVRYLSATRIHENTKTTLRRSEFVSEISCMFRKTVGNVPIVWRIYQSYMQIIDRDKLVKFGFLLILGVQEISRRPRELINLIQWGVYIIKQKLMSSGRPKQS